MNRQVRLALWATIPIMILLILGMHGVSVPSWIETLFGVISAAGISVTLTLGSASLVKAYVKTRDKVCLGIFVFGGVVQPVFLGLEMATLVAGAKIAEAITEPWLASHSLLLGACILLMLAVEVVGVVGVVYGDMVSTEEEPVWHAHGNTLKDRVVGCIRREGPGTTAQIAAELFEDSSEVETVLHTMLSDREVSINDKKWSLT